MDYCDRDVWIDYGCTFGVNSQLNSSLYEKPETKNVSGFYVASKLL